MDGRHYPSDLKDEQWQIIEPLLPPPSKVGSKRTVCRRRVFEAICCVNREGISWRALPHDFPKWTTVYWLFWDWRNSGLWQKMNDALRGGVRRANGRKPTPSAAIIDSQSAEDDGNGRGTRLRRGQEDQRP